jgi:MFS family permease
MRIVRDARLPVLAAVLISMSMVAIEATIVSTAMPQIVQALGDFELYGWIFAAYLLGQTSTTMLFGKLAHIHGRKPVLFVGLAIFAASSLLAGFSSDMLTLSILRGVQGLGAGAIHPVAMTVVGDLYRGPERGRVRAYFLAIWILSSLLGPPLSSLISSFLSWRWIFWLNLPFCCAAALLFSAFLREDGREFGSGRFDWTGSVLLIVTTIALVALLIASGLSGNLAWVAAFVFFAALAALLWHQGRQDHGVLALSLWKHPPIAVANKLVRRCCRAW